MAKRGPSKTLMGGGALLAAGILFGLFADLPGFGTGSDNTFVTLDPSANSPLEPTLTESDSEDAVDELGTQETVTVLIDDRSYSFVLDGGGETVLRPAELSQIISQTSAATGDENGIRIRILWRETARASAVDALESALANAGIAADSIYKRNEFVP